MTKARTLTNTSNTSSFTYASLAAMTRQMEALRAQRDRKVFVFEGGLKAFEAAVREAGGAVYQNDDGKNEVHHVAPLSSLCQYPSGLEVLEIGGHCLIGTPAALKQFLGPRPVEFVGFPERPLPPHQWRFSPTVLA